MGTICSVCALDHCPEAQMDQTQGCCICYNKQMRRDVIQVITLCPSCKRYELNSVTAC